MMGIHQQEHVTALTELFGSSKYSDLTVHCGEHIYKLHRAIVCQRSRFFAAACDGDFKEGATRTVTLHDDHPAVLRRMFSYLYTFDYSDSPNETTVQEVAKVKSAKPGMNIHGRMASNVSVYAVADKYEIPALKELAKAKFQALLSSNDKLILSGATIDAVFQSTPDTDRGLRDVIVDMCAKHVNAILKEPEVCSRIEEYGSLGLGLLREVLKQSNKASEASKKKAESNTIRLKDQNEALRSKLRLSDQQLDRLYEDFTELFTPDPNDPYIITGTEEGQYDLKSAIRTIQGILKP